MMICANNPEEMFVTVWLGILDISTGILTAANAGHEYPAFMHSDGSFELMKRKHDLIIGAFPNTRYREYQIQMTPGSKLFVYTDGVPEAANGAGELFGTSRMIDALNDNAGASPRQVLLGVSEAVGSFVRDSEQFDDLTMLCLEYLPGKKEQ